MKRIIALILALVMSASFVACSSDKEFVDSESTEISVTENSNLFEAFQEEANEMAESSDANVESSVDESKVRDVNNEFDSVYLEWKYSNWETASDADRGKCVIAYVGFLGNVLGWSVKAEDQSEEQMTALTEALESALKANSDITVREYVIYSLNNDPDNEPVSE
ncbi:MAG: hypothetical protein Q4C42_03310 [Clostridia bacterium]|nr:hypothetical protein [Clostridia bacterium]